MVNLHIIQLNPTQLALLLLIAIAIGPIIAGLLGHFAGISNAHAHVNHSAIGFIFLVLIAVVCTRTELLGSFVHSFDPPAYAATQMQSTVHRESLPAAHQTARPAHHKRKPHRKHHGAKPVVHTTKVDVQPLPAPRPKPAK
jgi:hypothetical protein